MDYQIFNIQVHLVRVYVSKTSQEKRHEKFYVIKLAERKKKSVFISNSERPMNTNIESSLLFLLKKKIKKR